jgi:ribose transport system substrate-binding protein
MIQAKSIRLLGLLGIALLVIAACGPGAATTRPGTQPPATGPAATATAGATQRARSPAAQSPAAQSPAAQSPAVGGSPTATSAPPDGSDYTLGFSNAFGVGNGFREEQLCTAKAEALVAGVQPSTWTHAEDTTYPQLQQIRDLIAQSPDAIIFNPNSPDGYQAAIDEAQAANILMVAIDGYVTDPETLNITNDQFNYGYIGASWLFDRIGEGNVYYMRGIVGHPADLDRHAGVMQALEEHPGITLLPSNDGVGTDWNPDTGTELINGAINDGTYDTFDGIWTSGIDQQIVDAIEASGNDFVPIVGADLKGFVEQLLHLDPKYEGLEGIAVYNPAAIGGAGVRLAIEALNGEEFETTTFTRTTADGVEHEIEAVVLPEPEAFDNVTPEGQTRLQEINVEELNVLWPVSWYINGWSDYTLDQMLACKGPGE